ncbi:Uncharacterized conserved protein, DUF302 family [Pseudomonas benzenivorans]|nr:DUF302 domain-containing protein [Pseudomonas benzenivorans]SDG80807.1 Uncharacterized conserved protein, DUF302 family [Pseudomonas benzenivorans]
MSNFTSNKISINHISATFNINFEDFISGVERLAGHVNADEVLKASPSTFKQTIKSMEGEGGLIIFGKLDHGVLFGMDGTPKKALRYYIGNPLIAYTMTKHDIRAALYAPLIVLIFEQGPGTVTVEYDQPSTLFGQFGVEPVTSVGLDLDAKLEALLSKAASTEN